MKASLNKLYLGAGYLAGVFMIGTLLSILTGIVGRFLAIRVSGMDAYAGYCMAASSFLALAYTLRHGEHIRVTLFLQYLNKKTRKLLEIIAHAIATFFCGALAWFSMRLVWQSYVFRDISPGLDATPLWIPQIGMAVGCLLLAAAFAEDFLLLLSGKRRRSTTATMHLE